MGLLDRRAPEPGQGFHELDLSEAERSGLCPVSGGRHGGRRRERLPQAGRHLTSSSGKLLCSNLTLLMLRSGFTEVLLPDEFGKMRSGPDIEIFSVNLLCAGILAF